MEHVKQFFGQPQFANCPDDVEAYARWALLPDGPAFHATPRPISCTFERGHTDYIVRFIPSHLPIYLILLLATRGYISIAFHKQSCEVLPSSSTGYCSCSFYLCIESTKGPLCTVACFRMHFFFPSNRVLILCNRLNALSPLSKREFT